MTMKKSEAPEAYEQVIAKEDLGRIIYDQAMQEWINPEIQKRHDQGLVDLPLVPQSRFKEVVAHTDTRFEMVSR
jgi:hypothetical protein